MAFGRSSCFRRWLLVFLVIGNVSAKQDRGTPVPTPILSEFPTESMHPTLTPTRFSSFSPSSQPTKEPTTDSPTSTASAKPTGVDTPSPTKKPTVAPTSQPTSSPTKSPMFSPVEKATSAPDIPIGEGQFVSVPLPTLGIDLILSDSDASSQTFGELDEELMSFIENVLAVNSGVDTFDYVELELDVIVSSFNRRRLDAGLSVKIDGNAYYGGEGPTEQDLTNSLVAYFSFWGVQDLETHLQVIGLSSARVAGISIDGEPVEVVSGSGGNAGAQVQQQPTDDDAGITPGLIAGLAVGSVVLLLAIGFLVFQISNAPRSGTSNSRPPRSASSNSRSQQRSDKQSQKSDEERQTDRIGADPYPSPQNRSGQTADDESSAGQISIDNSLYTTDESSMPQQQHASAKSYDPKRLDKVIAAAKRHSSSGSF